MNAPIIDPLQGDFPEVIEEYLQHGTMKCIAFNRRGTLLAAGCSDGSCVIWDFGTRGIAKELRDKDCSAAITSVSWSKYGHRILVSSADRNLILWDVMTGEKIARTTLERTPLHSCLHPGTSNPSICLACPVYSAPLIVDFNTGKATSLPTSTEEGGDENSVPSRNKVSDDSASQTPACFNKHGDLVYLGNSKGEILIIDHHNVQVRGVIGITGGAVIKNMVFSKNSQYLLTSSSDRIIRIYENKLPMKKGLEALDKMELTLSDLSVVEKLKTIGSKSLMLFHEFQDSVTRVHWKASCFSGDGEWVVGGSASKGEHKIYIWDRAGHLVKILEGPKEALIDLAWHPVKPIVVSVSLTGVVYIWAKDYVENWSAFAPDFKELEENEEYVEREDEFDIIPESEKVKGSNAKQAEEVDIITVDNDSPVSDLDMSQEELCFLPAIPCLDASEPHEKHVCNLVKSDGNHSASPPSAHAMLNRQAMKHDSSPVEVAGIINSAAEDTSRGGLSKRQRKSSEKVLEWQAEKMKKPIKKMKPTGNGKALKPKNRSATDQDSGASAIGDEVSKDS